MKRAFYSFLFTAFSFFIFETNALHANQLSFKPGASSSYQISQKVEASLDIEDEFVYLFSNATVGFDVKILSADLDSSSFPFDVEVVLKRISIDETQEDGESTVSIKYDSTAPVNVRNRVLAKKISKLINCPMVFRVDGEFQVEEITSILEDFSDENDLPSDTGLLGLTPWSFELILTQLFHLSGENLELTNSYPVSCYQLLNWEDEPLDEDEVYDEFDFTELSAYTVNTINSEKIGATWKGSAKIQNIEDGFKGETSIFANVTWDAQNPLIQERYVDVNLEATHDEFFPIHIKMSVQQTWKGGVLK